MMKITIDTNNADDVAYIQKLLNQHDYIKNVEDDVLYRLNSGKVVSETIIKKVNQYANDINNWSDNSLSKLIQQTNLDLKEMTEIRCHKYVQLN